MSTIVIMPGGFHPFHAGHMALYNSARQAFPDADLYVAATNSQEERPFPFAVKEKLAKVAGVEPGHFVQVKSPFQAKEITQHYNPEQDVLIFVRSEKDKNESPKPGGTKKDGSPAYFQPYDPKHLEPFAKHAYFAYLPTVKFGPGITSATEIRKAWPTLNDKRKTAMVMSLYPAAQKNQKLAANIVAMLDQVMGAQAVTESDDPWGPQGNFAGDTPINLGGVSMKNIQVGDTVKYLGRKSKVLAMSKDRKYSRITILSDFGGITKDVLTSDLQQLGQGVAEGTNDTVYPNAEVIKSKNGKPVGEIYQDGNSWGCFHYRADRGYDFIDSREEAIEALKDLHQETGRSRPDYTIKGVAEGISNLSIEQLAHISDKALDDAYHYGRSTPGANFGWLANIQSAKAAKKLIDAGETDIEKISDAIHKGWNVTAAADYKGQLQLDTPTPEDKKLKRAKLAMQSYAQLPEEEKEKDRVVARALLAALGAKVDETKGLPFSGTYEQENDMFKSHGPRRITSLTSESTNVSESADYLEEK